MHRLTQFGIAVVCAIMITGLLNTVLAQQVMRFQASEDTALMIDFRATAKDMNGKLTVENLLPMPSGSESSLKVGDVVISLNGKSIKTAKDWKTQYESIAENANLKLVVTRDGKNHEFTAEKTAAGSGGRQVVTMGAGGQGSAAFASGGGASENIRASKHLTSVVFNEADGKIKVVGIMQLNGSDVSSITLKPGDVVLGLNGTFVKTFDELDTQLSKTESGGNLRFAVERNGERQFVSMKKPSSN